MSDNGFGRYLTDEYKAKGRSEQADTRRADERAAQRTARAAEHRAAEDAEGAREDRRRGLAGLVAREAAKDEMERCGRGFGRYLV